MPTEKQRAYARAYYLAHRPRPIKRLSAEARKELTGKVQKQTLISSLSARLDNNIRSRTRKELFKQKVKIPAKVGVDLLGCSLDAFITHIESKFNRNITWKNYGAWHLDHIQSLSKFDLSDPEQLAKACHHTNYQPMWGPENTSKG